MPLSDRWETGQIIGVTRSTLLSICCNANDNVEIQVTKVMRSHSSMGRHRHSTLYTLQDDQTLCCAVWCLMWRESGGDVRCEMTEMFVIVSISSCYTKNWGEAILPIDDSVDVKRSDFDPRYVCRNLIKSHSDSDKHHECSSDCTIVLFLAGQLLSNQPFVVDNTNAAQLWKVWKIGFVSKFSLIIFRHYKRA